MKHKKRNVDLVVISDVHLGTYGCHAKELLHYLKSINPKKIILNGDIIDIWQFSKNYWPSSHMLVIKHLLNLIAKGTTVYYITGNHDEMLRKFAGFTLGNSFKIVNKVVLPLNGKKAWFFHGDVFDYTMQHSKWLAKLGATGYDTLILLNRFINWVSEKCGRGKISLSKKIKNRVKGAVKFINNFEQTAADIAIENKYDYVVCGHIHQPGIREIGNSNGVTTYLNSGDWVENLTALEYHNGTWKIYHYFEDETLQEMEENPEDMALIKNAKLFESLMEEFKLPDAS